MQLFEGMGERDRIFMHVGDDDIGMRLYYRDRMLEGSLENGMQGVTELRELLLPSEPVSGARIMPSLLVSARRRTKNSGGAFGFVG